MARPNAGLVSDRAGNLYGTTQQGGANSYGVVFKLALYGTETALHTFNGFSIGDAAYPLDGLVRDAKGNLYGTTQHGGPSDNGAVFEVSKKGTKKSFTALRAESTARGPMVALSKDAAGNFYGTTIEGGANNDGVVFKLSKSTETVLHNFAGSDGMYPVAGLILDGSGNL